MAELMKGSAKLPSLINPNQTCGIKGRNPHVNNRMLQDIISDLNSRGLGGAVLSLDQEKAFDRVDWEYLLCVLEHMNFGVSFRNLVSLFYTSISSSVLINGEHVIRSDPLIDGFYLPGHQPVKIFQYADDTSIIVMSDQALKQVFEVFRRYELASGAKLNVTKSHGLLMGSWTSRKNLPVALDWSEKSITIMGSTLSNGSSVASWQNSLRKFYSVLTSWESRRLSFHGRHLVANTFGLSLFWYLSSFLSMPDSVVHLILVCVRLCGGKNVHLLHNVWPGRVRSN